MVASITCRCTVCGSKDVLQSVSIQKMPVYCNVLWPSQDEAINAALGDIELGYCQACGHVFNAAFDPELMDYTEEYENSLHFSPKFNEYAHALANRLIEKYDIRDKNIVEIGCGKGDFLTMLCTKGNNHGYGFDKSFEDERIDEEERQQITFIQDYYDDKHADINADLICCRHVLEHIQHPQQFLSDIRRTVDNRIDTILYFEVPNALYTLKDMGIWDLIYEHCGYFTESSLSTVFLQAGFDILEIGESFGGQYLYVEAKPSQNSPSAYAKQIYDLEGLSSYVAAFDNNYRSKVAQWSDELRCISDKGQRAVIWGGGSKGVTFLNVLKQSKSIDYVIDLNPHKHGMFVPGTAQIVMAPEFLKEYMPDYIIIMNQLYKDEIEQSARDMGISAEVLCV